MQAKPEDRENRKRLANEARVLLCASLMILSAARNGTPADAPVKASAGIEITSIPLPGAAPGGVMLDYLAIDRVRHQVWVPAGGTGNTVVIDTKTQAIHRVEKFPTQEIERRGTKRLVGPSSATVGEGVVYVGNRGDSTVCAVDAKALTRGSCVTLSSMPDGLAFVPSRKEVWVTTPREQSITVLDVSTPGAPKLAGTIKLEGTPEGYAVDDGRGTFYTNLEDKDRTLAIDLQTRKTAATWKPNCGEDGPRGLRVDAAAGQLFVACTARVEVLDLAHDGAVLSTLDTGDGVDDFDYAAATQLVYVGAAKAGRLTVARVDPHGKLTLVATVATPQGARNPVVTDGGVVYLAHTLSLGALNDLAVVSPATK